MSHRMMNTTTKEHAIRERVILGTLANSAGQFITLVIGFFLTPFIVHQLGAVDYGLWALIGSIVAYAWLLDFGIWGALVKFIAEHRVRGEYEQAQRLIATGLWFYILLGLVAIGLSALVAPIFPHVFNVPPASASKAVWLVFLSGAAIGVSIPCATPSAVLRGLQRFDLVNLLNTTSTILYSAATVGVLVLGGGVLGMMIANIVLSLAMQVPSVYLINRVAPEMKFTWRGAEWRYVRKLGSFSLYLFIQQISHRLETKTDEITIGAFMPISAVTPYALARRLSEMAGLLTDQFTKVFLPIASELDAEHDHMRLRALYITGTRLVLAIFLPIGCTLVMFASYVLSAWVGAEYAQYAPLVWILTIAGFISASQWPASAVLQGSARHAPLARMSALSAISNLILSIILVHYWGLIGVALGTLIPTTLISLGLILPYAMQTMEIAFTDLIRQIVLPTLLPAAPMVITYLLFRQTMVFSSFISIGAVAIIGTTIYFLSYLIVGASQFERDTLRSILKTIAQVRLG